MKTGKKKNRCNPVSGYSVAPGYGWSERKNCKLLLLPGFHSDRDAGHVERKGEMERGAERWWRDGDKKGV